MPSSVGHILAGLAVTRITGGTLRHDWPYVMLSAAPDLDIAFAAMRNRPIDYRNRRSHSVGAALAVGTAAGLLVRLAGGRFLPAVSKSSASYASHLVLDYFGKEAADGLPLLWPVSDRRIAARRPIFRTIYSRKDRFFAGLLSRRNLGRVLRETAIVMPFIVAADLIGRAASR